MNSFFLFQNLVSSMSDEAPCKPLESEDRKLSLSQNEK